MDLGAGIASFLKMHNPMKYFSEGFLVSDDGFSGKRFTGCRINCIYELVAWTKINKPVFNHGVFLSALLREGLCEVTLRLPGW